MAVGLARAKAKLKTTVESRFELSESVFESLRTEGWLSVFNGTERLAGRLTAAVKICLQNASHFNPKRKSTPRSGEAKLRYWDRLDQTQSVLFELMNHGENSAPWQRHRAYTARQVLTEVCDPVTAREFRALSIAQNQLDA